MTSSAEARITLVTETNARDGFGNITQQTISTIDAPVQSRPTYMLWGELDGANQVSAANGRFPIRVTNALGHQEYREYDARTGAMQRLYGPNGLNTTWALDGFGRVTQETRADGTMTDTRRVWCTEALCPGGGVLKIVTATSGAPLSAVVLDVLGRPIKSVQQGFSGQALISATEYTAKGEVHRASRPYVLGDPITWASFTYDALSRVTSEATPAGTTTSTYTPLQVVVSDPLGHTSTTLRNVRGDTVKTWDAIGTVTDYSYDAAGNLRQVQVAGNSATQITNTYNIRGFKTAMVDPDTGSWSYQYNAFGELISQFDAKGQTTTLTYDALGRVSSKSAPEGTSTWTYDAAWKGVGQLASLVSAEGLTQSFTYDSLGRPSGSTTSIDGTSYSQSQSYDTYSRPLVRTYPVSPDYPSGYKVRSGYNSTGYLAEVRNDLTNQLFYAVTGHTVQTRTAVYGNGVSETVGYDTLGRANALCASMPLGTCNLQSLEYHFDAAGNLTERKDLRQGSLRESFVYDALNRLKETKLNDVVTKTMNYDVLGNLTQKTGIGSYQYDGNPGGCAHAGGVHAVKYAGGQASCYDANGNTLTSFNHTKSRARDMTYTSANLVKTVTEASQTETFWYDADGNRFKQTNTFTGETTHYLGRYERRSQGGVTTHIHHIDFEGQVIGIFESKSNGAWSLKFLHRDHLGSVTEITNDAGQLIERLSFDAWGKRREANWQDATAPLASSQTPRGYTGHEHLDDTNLIHMNGRVYDPDKARFTSADPIIQAAGYSQSFNRYSYVFNSPLNFTDPSGYSVRGFVDWVRTTIRPVITPVGIGVHFGDGGSVFGPPPEGWDREIDELRRMTNDFMNATLAMYEELDRLRAELQAYANALAYLNSQEQVIAAANQAAIARANQPASAPSMSMGGMSAACTPFGSIRVTGAIANAPVSISEYHPLLNAVGDMAGVFNRHDGYAVNPFTGMVLTPREEQNAKMDLAVTLGTAGVGLEAKIAARAGARATTDVVATRNGLASVRGTLDRIRAGENFPHRHDGSVFQNREGLLPKQPQGYYREYVHPTPGVNGAGQQRIIQGQGGEIYYSPDHYGTFVPLN